MDRFSLVAAEHSSAPILILDKEGSIGAALFARLKEYVQVVLVSEAEPEDKQNLLFLSFKKSIPHIPDEQYSHIFLVPENEKQLDDVFSSLSEKITQNKGKLIILLPKETTSQKTLTFLKQSGNNVYVLVLGDLFGGIIVRKLKSRAETLFTTAKKTQTLNLVGMGLRPLYPIEFTDAVTEIIRVAFGRPAGHLFFLYPKAPITELGVAHAIQKVDPLLKIDFRKGQVQEKEASETEEGEYLLASEYPLIERLQKAYETFIAPEHVIEEETFWEESEQKQYKQATRMFSPKKILGEGLLFFLVLSLLPMLTLVFATGVGVGGLYLAKNALAGGNLFQASIDAAISENAFSTAQIASTVAQEEIGGVIPHAFDAPEQLVTTGKSIATNMYTLLATAQQVFSGIKQKEISADVLQHSVREVKTAVLGMQKDLENPFIPSAIRDAVFSQLDHFSPILNTVDLLPDVLGGGEKKIYLVLFQNNMELRPGGGFIGSYGVLTLGNGKVENFTIHDVYDADGLLKGHIEPPFPVRRYIQKVHLYLRDSNYDIDFAKNAYVAALLFHQETGQTVDGVMAIDLSFVKNVLAAIGNVYVPTYHETVNADNFFLLTETHAEKNFFPGSSQKKDFLNSFFDSLQTKLSENKQLPYENLARALLASVAQKHVQIAFNDTGAEDLVVANSFASTLWDSRKQEQNTINDLLSINEANIGVNKVNYFITRTVSQDTQIHADGKITGSTTITYNNSDSANKWPGGPYKNYLRLFVPKGAVVNKILIDGVEQTMVPAVTSPADYEAKNFIAPKGLEVEHTDEGNTTYYGVLLTVDPGTTKNITFVYTLAQSIDLSQPVFSYSQWFLKQPGTDAYKTSFTLTYPQGYKIIGVKNLSSDGNTLRFSGEQTEDMLFDARLGKM